MERLVAEFRRRWLEAFDKEWAVNGRTEAEQMAAEHEAKQPVAWATFFPNGSTHSVFVDGHRTPAGAEPLYRSPTLTDAEREAVEKAIGWIESPGVEDEAMPEDYLPITTTLRGLLARCATSTR